MEELREELNMYKTVAEMSGIIVYRYGVKDDSMKFYFSKTEMSKYGSVINGYVQMLKRQQSVRQDIEAGQFIDALLNPMAGYFQCKARLTNSSAAGRMYSIVGRTIYDSHNNPEYIVGKMTDIDDNGVAFSNNTMTDGARDPLTGIYNKSGMKNRLADLCIRLDGKEAAFVNLGITGLKKSGRHIYDSDAVIINIAQLLKREFVYDVYIGRNKEDEFYIAYYGDVPKDRFLARLDHIRECVKAMGDVDVCGGIYLGSFKKGEEYEIREKAHMAYVASKYKDGNAFVMYSADMDVTDELKNKTKLSSEFINVEFDHKLVERSLDIIYNSGSVDEAIEHIFNKISRKYGIDRIMVQELDKENKAVNITYDWISDKYPYLRGIINRERTPEYSHILQVYNHNDMIVVPDTSVYVTDEAFMNKIKSIGLKAFVQCIFNGKHNKGGCVAFECYGEKHEWTDTELKTFKLITQLLSVWLINVRSYEEMLSVEKSYKTHDALTGLLKYEVFLTEAEKYIRRETTERLAIVYTGMADFLKINSRYGYDVGDMILKGFAQVVSEYDRYVMGCRVNADNFIFLVHAFDPRGNVISASSVSRLNDRFYEKCENLCPGIDISVCAGISVITEPETIRSYVERAFMARGRARNEGLDGVVG